MGGRHKLPAQEMNMKKKDGNALAHVFEQKNSICKVALRHNCQYNYNKTGPTK